MSRPASTRHRPEWPRQPKVPSPKRQGGGARLLGRRHFERPNSSSFGRGPFRDGVGGEDGDLRFRVGGRRRPRYLQSRRRFEFPRLLRMVIPAAEQARGQAQNCAQARPPHRMAGRRRGRRRHHDRHGLVQRRRGRRLRYRGWGVRGKQERRRCGHRDGLGGRRHGLFRRIRRRRRWRRRRYRRKRREREWGNSHG